MGRWMCVVVVLVAGCAEPAPPPSVQAALERRAATPAAELAAQDRAYAAAPETEADRQARRDHQARAICRARGTMAGAAMPTFGSSVNAAAAGGVWGAVANAQTEAACLDAYRATGILPSY